MKTTIPALTAQMFRLIGAVAQVASPDRVRDRLCGLRRAVLVAAGLLGAAGVPTAALADGFFSPDSFTAGIQEAVDRLPPDGGIVQLPPGRFLLRRSVHLRSNVTLRGSGAATVLTRPGQARSPLARRTERGAMSVVVEDGSVFETGCQIAIFPDAAKGHAGWPAAKVIVTAVDGNTLTLDRALEHAYDPDKRSAHNGWAPVVINVFPGISVEGESGVRIEDLKLDGSIAANPGPETSWTMAGIHLHGTRDAVVRNVTVSGWPSDGIGVQGGSGNRITELLVEDCRGHGFHPGTLLRHSVFSNIIARRNTQHGLYFCAGVQHVIVSDSLFEANAWSGVGGLGDSNDTFNLVANNVCFGNGQAGIHATHGADNSIIGNMVVNNSKATPGRFSGIHLTSVTDMTVVGNRCLDNQPAKTQSHGIGESGQSNRNLITGNHCLGNLKGGIRLVGPESVATGNMDGH